MKVIFILISIFVLFSCANVKYQERDEFTPNGYSQIFLKDNTYKIIYESYKRKGTESLLTKMATYRAAELTLAKKQTHFEIISATFAETLEDYTVPEQILKYSYGGGSASFGLMGEEVMTRPSYNEETVIPEHVRQFKVKRVVMIIKMMTDKTNDKSVNAQNIISAKDYR